MSAFAAATALRREGPTTFAASVPDQWQQGKGAFGGVAVGVLARALLAHEAAAERPLRSISAELCAPLLVAPSTIEVAVLRAGASMSFLDARHEQNGVLVGHATACVGKSRDVAVTPFASPPPVRPPWQDVPVLPVRAPLGPVFAQHYEYRPTGPLPFTGGPAPIVEGWVRELVAPEVLDPAAIVGLLDSWWPTTFATDTQPRSIVTVGYTMQLLVDPRTVPADEPLFYRARGVAQSGTYFVEMRELWWGDRVVGLNQQTFAILG